MAIQLNNISKTSILPAMTSVGGAYNPFSTTSTLRIYPSSVPFPSIPVNSTSGFVGGHILTYTTLTYSVSGNTISITAGSTSANASAAGTLGWWAILCSAPAGGALVSDSIGLSGSGSIVTTNTLTPSNGQSVTITFNLTLT